LVENYQWRAYAQEVLNWTHTLPFYCFVIALIHTVKNVGFMGKYY